MVADRPDMIAPGPLGGGAQLAFVQPAFIFEYIFAFLLSFRGTPYIPAIGGGRPYYIQCLRFNRLDLGLDEFSEIFRT